MSADQPARVVVLASGAGTNLQALLAYTGQTTQPQTTQPQQDAQASSHQVLSNNVSTQHAAAGKKHQPQPTQPFDLARAAALAQPLDTAGPVVTGGLHGPVGDFSLVSLVTDRADAGALTIASQAGLPTAVVEPGGYASRSDWDQALGQAVAAYEPQLVVLAGFMRLLSADFLARFPGRVINTHPSLLPSFPGGHAVRDALAHGVAVTGCTVHVVDAGIDTGPILAQCAVPVLPGDSEQVLHQRIKAAEHQLLCQVVSQLCLPA